jgi:hypothetical protein
MNRIKIIIPISFSKLLLMFIIILSEMFFLFFLTYIAQRPANTAGLGLNLAHSSDLPYLLNTKPYLN